MSLVTRVLSLLPVACGGFLPPMDCVPFCDEWLISLL
jgi:hypothetical protein